MNQILQVAKADFLEHSRRFSFIAMIALSLLAAYFFVPQDGNKMQIIYIQPDRFLQAGNPSWIPVSSAWGLGFFFPLAVFFYLRDSISGDQKSRVSVFAQVSPIGTVSYLFGKFLSCIVLMFGVALFCILGSFFMVFWHFPGQYLSLYDFLSPFIFLIFAIPFSASVTLLFDSICFLRGIWGSILYIIAFIAYFANMDFNAVSNAALCNFDFSGSTIIYRTVGRMVLEQSGQPVSILKFLGGGSVTSSSPTAQLFFSGVQLTAADFFGFAAMLCAAALLVMIAAPCYAVSNRLEKGSLTRSHKTKVVSSDKAATRNLPYLPAESVSGFSCFPMLFAELHLMLSGRSILWFLVSAGGILSCFFIDIQSAQLYVLPLIMLWFVTIFSSMGSREHQSDMLKNLSAISNGRVKQVMSAWLAGVTIAFTIALPVTLRFIAGDDIAGVLACVAGVVFLPSFALFLGELTKTSRAFEMMLIIITYLTINGVTVFRYMGTGGLNTPITQAVIYLSAGLVLGVIAVLKRIKQA